MTILGIIAEYNPFHNGHLYHLKKAKELTGADFSIAIMSGNFLQRGEPALWNKWVRAKMALLAGIDLIIELPFVFASQDAHGFAQAGVKVLNSLGIVDYITFGCEDDKIEIFSQLANLIRNDPPFFKKVINRELKKGASFPQIREKTILSFYQRYGQKSSKISWQEIKSILRQPNNILALEYIIALQSLKSKMKVLPIKRIGSGYSQDKFEGVYSSATAIRKMINQYYYSKDVSFLEKIKEAMPITSYEIILNELKEGKNPIIFSNFEQAIFAKLRIISLDELKDINGVQEGLENKIKRAALSTGNITELIQTIKSKRYTHTRIQRIIIHSLFNLTKSKINNFNENGPLYCRILGISQNGRTILKKAKSCSKIPLILKLKKFYQYNKKLGNDTLIRMLDYDILATNLYVLAYEGSSHKIGGQDFTNSINLWH